VLWHLGTWDLSNPDFHFKFSSGLYTDITKVGDEKNMTFDYGCHITRFYPGLGCRTKASVPGFHYSDLLGHLTMLF
jgi:hypothetical protein